MKQALACLLTLASATACKSSKAPPAAQRDPWASGSAAPTTTTGDAAKKWYEADAPVGVWMGMDTRMAPTTTADGTTYLSDKLQLATFVVWPDGYLSRGVPRSGLADFDRAAWERDVATNASLGGTPGTYTRDGSGWRVTYAGGHEATMSFDGNKLKIEKATFKRAANITGATLDGAYTYFSDPEDPSLAGPGCQRLVTFTRDGAFDNRGGFSRTCPPAPNEEGAPGTGTYEIRDFSLILKYADGRNVKLLITARQSDDLRTDNAHAIIMGQLWSRRSGAIASADATPTPTPTTATGDTTTYNGLAFTTPPGKAEQGKTSLSFTATDGDAFCMTTVFTSLPTTGDPDGDFAAEWNDVMLNGRTADETPTPQKGQTPSGLVFSGAGTMTTETANNARVYRALFVFEVGARRTSVMFVAPTQAQLAACKVEDFLGSVRGS